MQPGARAWAAAALLACAALAARAQEAVATIVDGPATLVRELGRHRLVEGVRLRAGDLVETGADTRVLRLELADGGHANLGPSTRLMVGPPRAMDRRRPPAPLYLLQGWLKSDRPVASPLLHVTAAAGPLVLQVADDGVQAFSESGGATLADRRADGAPVTLTGGQLFARPANGPRTLQPRPSPAFLERLPRAFLDTLPALASRFEGRSVAAPPLAAPRYEDLQPWLQAEPALRRALLPRWTPLARQPEFRRALQDALPAHPEWEPVLFPERFRPASAARAAPSR